MWKIFLFSVVILQAEFILSKFIPSSKCNLSDKTCLKNIAQASVSTFTAGLPELGIEPLDVMHVDKIDVDLAGLLLNMKDLQIKGMKKAVIDDISFDMKKKVMKLKYHVNNSLKGKYKASGLLLGLPITGDGDIHMVLDYLEVFLTVPFEIVKDNNGKDTIELKSFKFTFDVKNNVHVNLTNLFNGNKVLVNKALGAVTSLKHNNCNSVPQTLLLSFNFGIKKTPSTKTVTFTKVSRNGRAVSLQVNEDKSIKENSILWAFQACRIILIHNQGTRIAVIMRGLPGSGKSYMAKYLIDMTVGNSFSNYKKHIFGTDDYFIINGTYNFDLNKLSKAHAWNINRATTSMRQGLSPIIIDNTNINMQSMEHYAREAVANGYVIEIAESNTQWAKNVSELFKRNVHGVPINIIENMIKSYQNEVTPKILMDHYALSYPADMIPPVKRIIPELRVEGSRPDISQYCFTANNDKLTHIFTK